MDFRSGFFCRCQHLATHASNLGGMPWGKRAASPFGRLPTASRSNLTRQLIFRPAHHVFGAARGRGACTFAGGSRRRAMWLVDFRGHHFFTSFFTLFFTTLFPVFHPPRISRTAHTCHIFGCGPVKIHNVSPSRGFVTPVFHFVFHHPFSRLSPSLNRSSCRTEHVETEQLGVHPP